MKYNSNSSNTENFVIANDKTMTHLISRAQSEARPDIRCARFVISKFVNIWTRMVACSPTACGQCKYRRIKGGGILAVDHPDGKQVIECAEPLGKVNETVDLVIKVSILGDSNIGKTSFMTTYVGMEDEKGIKRKGVNLVDKTMNVRGATISFSICDVQGGRFDQDVPKACKDSIAILFMFDLTSRCTLNNVIDWYQRARRYNTMALTILIGTKFDEFTELPLEMQCMIIQQARAYARVMNATLFFSSAKHNINVNKIFKFITAKVFNLPWTVHRNLKIGEPIIDF